MAKAESKEPGRREMAAAAGKAAAAGTWKILVWAVLIVAACLLVWRALVPPPDEDRATPEAFFQTYTDFVRGYGTTGAPRPSQINVRAWLQFFDDDFGGWFRQNADRFALLQMRDPDTWRGSTREDRESEAMVFVITHQAFRGGRIRSLKLVDEGNAAEVVFERPAGTYQAVLGFDGKHWHVADAFGMREALQERADAVRLPGVLAN